MTCWQLPALLALLVVVHWVGLWSGSLRVLVRLPCVSVQVACQRVPLVLPQSVRGCRRRTMAMTKA